MPNQEGRCRVDKFPRYRPDRCGSVDIPSWERNRFLGGLQIAFQETQVRLVDLRWKSNLDTCDGGPSLEFEFALGSRGTQIGQLTSYGPSSR